MKKRIDASINAHVRRGAFYVIVLLTVTLLALFQPAAQPTAFHPAAAGLTFAERVAYQRAIEDVYWRHRIWPKECPDPKPSLDAVMSQAQIEKKVTNYLRNSQALQDDWRKPITAEQLQGEMERMAGMDNPVAMRSISHSKDFLDGQKPVHKAFLADAVKDGRFMSFDPNVTEWTQRVGSFLDRAFNGSETAEVALKKAAKEVNEKFFKKP